MKDLLLEYLLVRNKLDDFKEWLKNEGIEAKDEIDEWEDMQINIETRISNNPFG
jgi:hypothetical protein